MRIGQFLLALSAVTGTRGASKKSPLEQVKLDPSTKGVKPVALKPSPANLPINGPSHTRSPSTVSVTETDDGFEVSDFHSTLNTYLQEARDGIEAKLLKILNDRAIDQPKANQLESKLLAAEQHAHQNEGADSNNGGASLTYTALAISTICFLYSAYRFAQQAEPPENPDADEPSPEGEAGEAHDDTGDGHDTRDTHTQQRRPVHIPPPQVFDHPIFKTPISEILAPEQTGDESPITEPEATPIFIDRTEPDDGRAPEAEDRREPKIGSPEEYEQDPPSPTPDVATLTVPQHQVGEQQYSQVIEPPHLGAASVAPSITLDDLESLPKLIPSLTIEGEPGSLLHSTSKAFLKSVLLIAEGMKLYELYLLYASLDEKFKPLKADAYINALDSIRENLLDNGKNVAEVAAQQLKETLSSNSETTDHTDRETYLKLKNYENMFEQLVQEHTTFSAKHSNKEKGIKDSLGTALRRYHLPSDKEKAKTEVNESLQRSMLSFYLKAKTEYGLDIVKTQTPSSEGE